MRVKLKIERSLKALCTEYEGVYNQDMIKLDYDFLSNNGFKECTYHGVFREDGIFALIVKNEAGQGTLVHLSWIKEFEGETVELGTEEGGYIGLTSKHILNKETGEIVDRSSLPTCSHCGNILTVPNEHNLCSNCVSELTHVNGYSHRPTPIFIGQQLPKDKDNNCWFGIEVEVSTDKHKLAGYLAKYNKDKGLYLKSDSSIKGDGFNVEIVSHPHSFTELMKEDGWLSNIHNIPTNNHTGNGTHVHISRTAFKDDKHYSLFYFLLHKMESICTKVGGRDLNNYCQIKPTGKVHTKGNKKETGGERYLFINELNEKTVEIRFFIGTTNSKKLKSYIQLLESMIKYTKYHSRSVSSDGWFQYITKKSSKYTELLEVLKGQDVKGHKVIFREPKLVYIDRDILKFQDIVKIVGLVDNHGKTHDNIVYKYVTATGVFVYKDKTGSDCEALLTSITQFIVERE